MSDSSYYSRFDSCCFCFNLKIGTQLIAYFTWFFCFIEILTYLVALYHIESNLSDCYTGLATSSTGEDILLKSCFNDSLWIVRAMILFRCIHYFVGFIGALLMLKGISMRRPSLFNVWLVYAFIAIGISVMSFGTLRTPRDSFSRLVSILFLIYFVMAVTCYQKQLRNENEGTLPVSAITRPEQVHLPGRLFQSTLPAVQPKDYPPPPYSAVSPPPPPYSSVKPSSSNEEEAAAASGETAESPSDASSVGPPPAYDDSVPHSSRSTPPPTVTVVGEQPKSDNPPTVEV